jgi:hypothetical protein
MPLKLASFSKTVSAKVPDVQACVCKLPILTFMVGGGVELALLKHLSLSKCANSEAYIYLADFLP